MRTTAAPAMEPPLQFHEAALMGNIPEDYRHATRGLRPLFIVAIVILLVLLWLRSG